MEIVASRIAVQQGRWPDAAHWAQQALNHSGSELGERANALRQLGLLALREQRYADAQNQLQAALALDQQLARPRGLALTLRGLADLATAQGNTGAAQQYTQRWQSICNATANACLPD